MVIDRIKISCLPFQLNYILWIQKQGLMDDVERQREGRHGAK